MNLPKCMKCKTLLEVGKNWYRSSQARRYYLCIPCSSLRSKDYRQKNKEICRARAKTYYKEHREERLEYEKEHYDAEESSAYLKEYVQLRRIEAMKVVMQVNNMTGEPRCARDECGCMDLRFLEFNFKTGGHRKLRAEGALPTGSEFYIGIIKRRIDPKQFEILCKPHNSIDHLERKTNHRLWNIRWSTEKIITVPQVSGVKNPLREDEAPRSVVTSYKDGCKSCGAMLTEINWYESDRKHHTRLCINCRNAHDAARYIAQKEQAIRIVSNSNGGDGLVHCDKCACDDVGFLEFNFKAGGHSLLSKNGGIRVGVYLIRDILKGKVDASQFNILCKAHNSIAHLKENEHWVITYSPWPEPDKVLLDNYNS